MFLHLSVSHSVHRGGSASRGGGLHLGGGSASSEGWVGKDPHLLDTTGYSQRVGCTHPTGMHSSSNFWTLDYTVECTFTLLICINARGIVDSPDWDCTSFFGANRSEY